MVIRINPLDTFFFRDGKPFTMGTETWADGIFPPPPSVLYGALRSLWISEQIDGFTEDNINKSSALKIKSIFFEIDEALCLPVPNDFVHEKDKEGNKFYLEPMPIKTVNSGVVKTAPSVNISNTFVEEHKADALFSRKSFEYYLQKTTASLLSPIKDYLIKESKIGIGRKFETRTTEDGELYRVDFRRFKVAESGKRDAAIVVEFEGLEFNNPNFMRLGGEAKATSLEIEQQTDFCKIEEPTLNGHSFRLCLATPAIFNKGNIAEWMETGEYKGIKLTLKCVTTSRYQSLGGFGYNLQTKKFEPKNMYRAVQTGTVFWFDYEGDSQTIIDTFHAKSISEINANEGFGIAYVGA